MAIDDAGNAFVTWAQWNNAIGSNAATGSLHLRRYIAGSGWQPDQVVADNIDIFPQIQIAVAPASGQAMLIWGQNGLWAKAFDPVSGWGPSVLLDTGADYGFVGLDANGAALVAWQNASGFSVNRYVFGTGWGTPVSFAWEPPVPGMTIEMLSIRISPTGDATVTWQSYVPPSSSCPFCLYTNFSKWTNQFTPSGGWGTASQISNSVTDSPVVPPPPDGFGLFMSPGGTALAAVNMTAEPNIDLTTTSELILQASVLVPNSGAWSPVQTLSTSPIPMSMLGYAVNVDDQGNVHVAWYQPTDSGTSGLWTSSYSASSGIWSAAQLLPDTMASNVQVAPVGFSAPGLASDAKGDAVFTWMTTSNQLAASYQPAS
jgi:hypothetical protein